MGDKFGRVLFLKEYASYIKDSMISELTALNRTMMLSIDVIPVPTDEAVQEMQNRLLGVETNVTNWQRRQNSNNNFSAVVPLVHLADSKEELDSDTDALQSAARKHLCQLSTLNWQQADGLVTALPLGLRRIDALRTLTTEVLAVLMPFKAQEVRDQGGVYYGQNVIRTAPVVRRMFEMCAAGIGSRSIATVLNNEGILSPKEYTRFRKHNPERDGEFERRHFWTRTYVQFMLKNEIYVGSMVQGRQYTPSYRSKKREPIPKEDWVVVPDMHEPIVSRELFDEAQKRMGAREKTIKAKDEPDLFAGLFFCEACGTSMLPKVSQQKYFYYNCGRSHAIGQLACSSHYINRDTLPCGTNCAFI